MSTRDDRRRLFVWVLVALAALWVLIATAIATGLVGAASIAIVIVPPVLAIALLVNRRRAVKAVGLLMLFGWAIAIALTISTLGE